METMHSKLIRLQTALLTLALLFTVLIPVSAYAEGENTAAQATADGTTISDPNTFNAWAYTQAYNNATTGRIWADKTVEEGEIDLPSQGSIAVPKNKGADFLVALSALSSYASTTTTDTQALDIVMVLDASGSMNDPMGGGDSTKRMDALKTAVGAFIDNAKNQNAKITDTDKKIKLSIVKFAGNKTDTIGNDTYRDGRYTYNYSQIVKKLTVCENNDAAALKEAVNRIQPAGATQADFGMEHAQTVLNSDSARTNAKKVVIFFTDGTPTSQSNFESSVASSAIETAKSLKAAGAEVYTVGIFSGANPNADVSEASSENKFMQAVSSNYPLAAYDWIYSGLFGWDSYWSWNFGNRPDNANYYLAASSADGLKTVFEDIFNSISITLAGPTHVTDKPETDGYVTFDDPLGDYMEVKSFEAVAFSDQVFNVVDKTSTDTVDTYTFTGTHGGTVSGAYPETADLKDIIITVTHGSGSDGDHVQVKIPASMLPLRYYKATNTDGTQKLEVNDAQPISVIYSVGLKGDARSQITSGNITDDALASYVAANAEGGKVSFYSNKYDGSLKTADGKKTIGQTTATFTPATSNSFYYHTEDTLLYTKEGEPVTTFETGKTYYYKLNYLHQNPTNRDETLSKTDMVPMHIDTDKAVTECIGKNAAGQCYIKKGIKKGSLPSAIDSQLGDKDKEKGGNKTGTAERRIDFQWNLATNMGVLYLGNNGKLTMDATGSVKVTKVVKADEGLNPNANTDFTMKFELAGNNVNANAEYKYTVTGTEETKTIKNGGTFTLKDGQTAEIVGLPVGSNYTITEQDLPAGYNQTSITDNSTGKVTAGTAQEVTVTNTYEPEGITVDPDTDNYPFTAEKILQGRNWRDSDTFTFQLQAVTPGAPLPAGATESNDIRYKEYMVKGPSEGATAGMSVPITFGSVTFTKPGTYEYDITEIIPTDKIPGVSYDSSFYHVTVTIVDDGTGKLMMNQPAIEHIFGSDITTDAQIATFTNTFENEEEKLAIQATKLYRDSEDKPMQLTDGQFHFKLEAATVDEENNPLSGSTSIPMPSNAAGTVNNENGEITFADITYSLNNQDEGNTYYYLLTEVPDDTATITYSTEQYLIKVEVSADTTDTTAGELLKVTPTYYRWNATKTKWEPVNANELTFTNKFTGKTTAQLGVSKSISGRDWKDDEKFTFALEAQGNAPMPTNEGDATATATKSTPAPTFGEITYTKAGIYTYTIKETSKPTSGMTNAENVTATVTVALDAESNELKATVTYSSTDTENNKAKLIFHIF